MSAARGLLVAALAAALGTPTAAQSIRRIDNGADGAPAFEVREASGRTLGHIRCLWNGWTTADGMAARVLGSKELMAAVLAKGQALQIEDLGPAKFDCVFHAALP